MTSKRACPICDSAEKTALYRRRFATISNALLEGYDVVVCNQCGFCFADNLPLPQEFEAYYEQQSKYEADYRSLALSEFDTRRLPFSIGIIAGWLPDRNARILDIGCATGGMLAELKNQGYRHLLGVDPSPACARAARELFGLEVVTAPISRIPATLGPFDLVIFGSVLEHVVDLDGTAKRVKQLLKPNGCVHVEVPDMTRCTQLNDAPFQEFSVEHINYFSPVSLQNLWSRHGFQPIGIRQTEIMQVPGLKICEIKAMFRSVDGATHAGIQADTQTKQELDRYVIAAQAKLDGIEHVINTLAESRQPIIVWGVGTHTQSLMATTRLKEANIRAFVDSNARYANQQISGIPILPVAELANHRESILVSSQQFQAEIVHQIRSVLRMPNEIITLYELDLKVSNP